MAAEQTRVQGQMCSSEWSNFTAKKHEKQVCSHQKLAMLPSTETLVSIHPKFGIICLPASEKAVVSDFNALLRSFVGY